MKRILGLLVMVSMLVLPSLSFAAEQVGVYVAPKFVYGLVQATGTKTYEDTYDSGVFNSGRSYIWNIGSETDSTFGGSLAVGYDFGKRFNVPIRTELEYSIFSNGDIKKSFTFLDGNGVDIDTDHWKQQLRIQTLFINAYWDINTGTSFTPYVGAGLGIGIIRNKFSGSGWNPGDGDWSENFGSKTTTNFAWNVGAGLGYDINDSWTVDLGYRFVGLGSVKTSTFSEASSGTPGRVRETHGKIDNLFQHQVSLGVRYTF
jgi:opacity protein-like surface antigen